MCWGPSDTELWGLWGLQARPRWAGTRIAAQPQPRCVRFSSAVPQYKESPVAELQNFLWHFARVPGRLFTGLGRKSITLASHVRFLLRLTELGNIINGLQGAINPCLDQVLSSDQLNLRYSPRIFFPVLSRSPLVVIRQKQGGESCAACRWAARCRGSLTRRWPMAQQCLESI